MSDSDFRIKSTPPVTQTGVPMEQKGVPLASKPITIEKSQAAFESSPSSFQIPILDPPSPYVIEKMTQQVLQQKHEIIMDILKGWSESIAAISEEVRILIKSPFYQAQLQRKKLEKNAMPSKGNEASTIENYLKSFENSPIVFLATLFGAKSEKAESISKIESEHQRKESIGEGARVLSKPLLSLEQAKNEIYLLLSYFVGKTNERKARTLETLEITPTERKEKSSIGAVNQETILLIPPEAVPLINLMLLTMVYRTAWSTATEGLNDKQKEKPIDLKMAEKYAKKIIKELLDPQFLKVSDSQESRSTSLFYKLVLASSALMLLYTAEAGKVTPEEFHGVLKGEINFPHGSLQYVLVSLIKEQLQQMSIQEGAAVIEALFHYIDGSPDPKEMMEPVHVFQKILKDIPDERIGKTPV